jgi:hypothetical protein
MRMEPFAVVLAFVASLGLALGAAFATLAALLLVMHRGLMSGHKPALGKLVLGSVP